MNAVLLGSTGLIGRALLNLLLIDPRFTQIWLVGRSQPVLAPDTAGANKVIFVNASIERFAEPSFFQSQLPNQIDCVFCCLGTTLKIAGSKAQFIAADKTAVINFARGCKQACHPKLHFLLVSALGANPHSSLFYNQVKGELETELRQLDLPALSLFRPCLLLGKRGNTRLLEDACQRLFAPLAPLFIGPLRKIRPITAKQVATQMIRMSVDTPCPTVNIISNQQMHLQR